MTINATGNRMTAEIARQSRLAQDIARTQIAISSGKRFGAPSGDPVAAARVALIDRHQSDNTTWTRNLSQAASLVAQADSALADLSDRMIHARELMVAASSGTATAADRTTYAAELRALAADVAELRGTKTPTGESLFATGNAASLRVAKDVVLAPVASAADIFANSGIALTQDLADAVAALDRGDTTRMAVALGRLGTSIDHVADAAADQGLRAARIDRLTDRQAAHDIDLAAERSGLEDTDLTTAIARLNAQQLTLDAAQAAFARINRRSLFDILG